MMCRTRSFFFMAEDNIHFAVFHSGLSRSILLVPVCKPELRCLPLGVARAAQPAVLLTCGSQGGFSLRGATRSLVFATTLACLLLSSGWPRCTSHALDEVNVPELFIIWCLFGSLSEDFERGVNNVSISSVAHSIHRLRTNVTFKNPTLANSSSRGERMGTLWRAGDVRTRGREDADLNSKDTDLVDADTRSSFDWKATGEEQRSDS